MNTKQIMKWFVDHNIIIQKENDIDRLKYLTFLSAVFLELDEDCSILNLKIDLNVEYEDYSFDTDTILLLNCVNHYYGYRHDLYQDPGFVLLKIRNISSFQGKYMELADTFSIAKSHVLDLKDYDFSASLYYNGYNTFFYHEDLSFTEDDLKFLNIIRKNQDTFELSRHQGKLVIF